MRAFLTRHSWLIASAAVGVWLIAHIPGVVYGTYQLPLHQSYIGDEQSAVNGVFHMLQEKSLLGFRDVHTLYYGPVFVIIDTPAVLIDFAEKLLTGAVHSAAGYENYIIYDWGGVVFWLHVTAVISCLLGLWAVWALMSTRTMNPAGRRWLPALTTALVAVNFYYFEYSHFAKHWAFILPLFIVQALCLVRISETRGDRPVYWIVHALATIVIFGISYFAVVFTVMWIPWLWTALRRRDWKSLRRFALYALVMLAGFVLMVAWDPYPFVRNISFLGVGTPQGGIGDAQNPLAGGDNSLWWYGVEIVLNELSLAVASIILAVILWKKAVWRSPQLWLLLYPALVGYLFFGLASHHEGRYMLPTVVFLILATGYMLSLYVHSVWQKGGAASFTALPSAKRTVQTALITLVACYGAFQVVVDAEWMIVYAQGPLEKIGIAEALQLQKSAAPVLLIQPYIAGQVHDKASYAAEIAKRGRNDVNLYQAIMAGTPPADVPELDVRYVWPQDFAADPGVTVPYTHAIWEYEPIPNEINQFDYFDEDVMGLWYYDELSPHWIVLK